MRRRPAPGTQISGTRTTDLVKENARSIVRKERAFVYLDLLRLSVLSWRLHCARLVSFSGAVYALSLRRSQAVTVFVGSTASASSCISTTFPFMSMR